MKIEQTLSTEVVTGNSEQLAVLKSNFPQCFDRHGKFILSKLQDILQANAVDVSRESYSLNWLGKSYARVLANEPIRTMLSEDHDHNQLEHNKNSRNLLIQGDNLEVLKHLKGAYTDKIKMIYIDPPYNTGSDGFVYQDDRSFSPEQFAELAGVDLDEAKRVLDFTQSNANSHSAWLTFIYPRLYIAKQLLKEDGVIFISIDDNEQAQLKILCDEVFGEANFLSQIIVQSNKRGQTYKEIAKCHEYLFVYYKSNQSSLGELEKVGGALPYIDEFGSYDLWELRNRNPKFGRHNRPNLYYPIYVDETSIDENGLAKISLSKSSNFSIEVFPKNSEGVDSCWRWGVEKLLKEGINSKQVAVWAKKKRDGGWNIYEKSRKDTTKAKSLWLDTKFINEQGTIESGKLGMSGILEFPKPIELIKQCILLATNELDIVLDFFAGSGTTGHAVLNQNAEDGGNRQFICVQIAEQIEKDKEAYKAGYRTIFEITKDRIIKAGEKLVQDYPESYFERGFKIFKTCDNFLPLSSYRDLKQLTLEQTNTSVVTTDFDDTQLQDILTTWKGQDKILLSENLNVINLGDYIAYGSGHILYLVNQGFNTVALKELIKKLDDEHEFQVSKLVILGHHFDSKSQREIDEAMKNYNNKKSIPVDVVVRY